MTTTVGSSGWEHGPLLISSEACRLGHQRTLTHEEARELAALRGSVQRAALGGAEVLAIPRGTPAGVIPLDERAVVIVQFLMRGGAGLSRAEETSPWWVSEEDWQLVEGSWQVEGELQLFDAMARVAAQAEGSTWGDEQRAQRYLSLPLTAGEYVVEWASFTCPTRDQIFFVRLRQAGYRPARPAEILPVPQYQTVTLTDAVVEQATALTFVGHGDGGPTVILSNSVRDAWLGVGDGGEQDHYRLACESMETFEFMGTQAFCLQEEGSTAVVTLEDGLLLPRWVAADSPAGVLGVALAASYQPVLRDGEPVYFESAGGRFTLQHAVDRGAHREEDAFEFELPAGRYRVEQIDAKGWLEWQGRVLHPSGDEEEVMVQAYRFRRV